MKKNKFQLTVLKNTWYNYPEFMPSKSEQYEVKWSNGNTNIIPYHNGFITINEMRRMPPHNEVPEVYVIAWRYVNI